MVDKELEKHAVAGARDQLQEYLKVFEGKLWIKHEDHLRECDEAQRLGEARYRQAIQRQGEQILDMMAQRNKLTLVLLYVGFQKLTKRTGGTPSMDPWSVEMTIGGQQVTITAKTPSKVIEESFKRMVAEGVIVDGD